MSLRKPLVDVDGVTQELASADWLRAGPSSTSDNAVARYDGTAGVLQNSAVTIDDDGNVNIYPSTGSYAYALVCGKVGTDIANQSALNFVNRPTVSQDGAYDSSGVVGYNGPTIASGKTNSGLVAGIVGQAMRGLYAGDLGNLAKESAFEGYYGHWNTSTPGTTTAVRGIHLEPYLKAGTIGDIYDIHVDALTAGGTLTGTHYGFYILGSTKKNYLAGSLGIGAEPTATNYVNIAKTISAVASGNSYAQYTSMTTSAAETTYATIGGGFAILKSGANNNTGGLRGLNCSAQNDGAGNVSEISAAYFYTGNAGAGTVTTAYSLVVLTPLSAGAITTAYGLLIQGQKRSGVTTGYSVYASGADDKAYFNHNVGIGGTSFGTSATRTLLVASGTAPSTSPADAFQMYSADFALGAGQACPHIRIENGTVVRLNQDVSTEGNPRFSSLTADQIVIGNSELELEYNFYMLNANNTVNFQLSDTGEFNITHGSSNTMTAASFTFNCGDGDIEGKFNFTNPSFSSMPIVFTAYDVNSLNFNGTCVIYAGSFAMLAWEAATLTSTGGSFALGNATTIGTNATNTLVVPNGTSPASSPADLFQNYAKDENSVAGKSCSHWRTEGGTEVWHGEGVRALRIWDTPEGGRAVKLVAGENLVLGEVVYVKESSGADGKVWKNPVDGDMPVGVVYANASADADVWVVVAGIASVLPLASITAARGQQLYSSATTAGRVDQTNSPSTPTHWREVGHWLDTGSGNGAATRALVHFN